MRKICLEQKGQPPIRASLEEATFLTFPYWKNGEPFKLLKVGSARRVTHFVQLPFCNGRVSLLAGPTFLRRHFTRFPLNKNYCLKFWKNHVPSGRYIPVAETNQSHRDFIVLVSRIQIIGPGENNFVKWKETFRSDRLDQIRSVSVKGSHSQGEIVRACAKAGWGQFFFLSRLGKWLWPTWDRFSPYKEN